MFTSIRIGVAYTSKVKIGIQHAVGRESLNETRTLLAVRCCAMQVVIITRHAERLDYVERDGGGNWQATAGETETVI